MATFCRLAEHLFSVTIMADEQPEPTGDYPASQQGEAGADLVEQALAHLRGSLSGSGEASWPPSLARQKTCLAGWAENLGLLLAAAELPSKSVKGGQEHDLWHDEATDRFWKSTRDGVFGLQPGIELALVSSAEDARRFHLWEASPLEYLERLQLHNLLVPNLNRLEGFIVQPDEFIIVTSQPRFDIVPVTTGEIDEWFASLGFGKITSAGYYRAEDNLGVFDAHDRNLVRFEDSLIPFDVIPCRPAGGFREFIEEILASGHTLQAVRTTNTS